MPGTNTIWMNTVLYILTSILYLVRGGHRLAQTPVAANPQMYLLEIIESY